MKVVLSHAYFLNDDPKERQIMKPYVPLGLLGIAAYLEQHEVPCSVLDSTFLNRSSWLSDLKKNAPALLGLYANLMTRPVLFELIQLIRSEPALKNTKIVLGGPDTRYNADLYLNNGADLLVVGEGETTFLELTQHLREMGQLPNALAGTVVLKNGESVFNAERPLIRQLDLLPLPAREKVHLENYLSAWKTHHGYSSISVSTMRGCPYTCKWCSRAVYGGTYRRRSPAAVVEELAYLKATYQPDRFWFVDDVFTISHKWLEEFHAEVKKCNLEVAYEIITRADRMNAEVIRLLKESGCYRIWIGAESGAQEIINAMDRRVDAVKVREMIVATRKAGMEAGTFIMVGYPGETRKHLSETIEHLRASRPDFYTITTAYPIAGTPLFEEVKKTLEVKKTALNATDRDYDFKRTHSKRYYQYAIRWIHNAVGASHAKGLKKINYQIKSLLAQTIMFFV
jgi:radical SAM superfamily enzyme YgiQ (UPF0313 family)